MLEAQKRGHSLSYYTPTSSRCAARSWWRRCRCSPCATSRRPFYARRAKREPLNAFDVILLRQDPPFDLAYITSTHLLERIHPKTLVVNDPGFVRNAPEKTVRAELSAADAADADLARPRRNQFVPRRARRRRHEAAARPWRRGGVPRDAAGHEFRLAVRHVLGHLPRALGDPALPPEVKHGDKRIILVDGEFAGAVNRVPAPDDLRSNMVRGGAAQATDLSAREREICAHARPGAARARLLFVGIDVIDGNLTEINVTCPTGIRAIARLNGPDVAGKIWDTIEKKRGGK
jgi:glutathione synthase